MYNIDMTTEKDLDTSLNFLEHVILNDEAAKTIIHEAWKNSQVNISYVMKFKFYRNEDWYE